MSYGDTVPESDYQAVRNRLEQTLAENVRLKTLIEGAPHGPGCGVKFKRKSDLDGCDCWKARALR